MTWKSIFYFLLPWCTLSEKIYFEKQAPETRFCVKHSLNNCVQRQLISVEDWQKYIARHHAEEHHYREAAKKLFGTHYDPDQPFFAQGLVDYIHHVSGAAISATIEHIPPEPKITTRESHRRYNDMLYNLAEAYADMLLQEEGVCFLINGEYLEAELSGVEEDIAGGHMTTLTKVFNKDDGTYEVWYLDSKFPPESLEIGSVGKEFNPPDEPIPIQSFKLKDTVDIHKLLSYFMTVDFTKRAPEPRQFFIDIAHDTAHSHTKRALSRIPKHKAAPMSAMEVVPEEHETHERLPHIKKPIEERREEDAKREYKDIVAAKQQYLALLEDYEYDVAIEEAREKRVIQRLSREKQNVLSAKRKFGRVKKKTYDRY